MLSLVIPCYNEADVLRLTHESLVHAARQWNEPIEIILVDDGSQDATWEVIASLAERDPRVRGVRLSRNFGHQAALGAGLAAARGDAVVTLDADLQDPPELIAEMLAKWRGGYDVVYAQRVRRHGVPATKRIAGSVFYRLLDRINTVAIPRDTGDFALLDSRVVRHLLSFREHALFWRGLRCWSGFRQAAVTFERPGRARGVTKYSLRKLAGLASDGLLSFSPLPLRLALYAGLFLLMATPVAALGAAAWCLIRPGPTAWPVPATMLALLVLGSLQLISLGIVGEYLNRVYDEVRDRPRWIVAETIDRQAAEMQGPGDHRQRLAG